MLTNFMYGTTDSTLTIEWTPPPNAGNAMYNVAIDPVPVSGNLMDINSNQITITVAFNINYDVNISVNTMCAELVSTTILLGKNT